VQQQEDERDLPDQLAVLVECADLDDLRAREGGGGRRYVVRRAKRGGRSE
jgi:hypothetical protein